MNKSLIVAVLTAYVKINDGSLTIVTDNKVFNQCCVTDTYNNLVYVRCKDKNLYRIELDDIIGIQFIDMMAMVGMK